MTIYVDGGSLGIAQEHSPRPHASVVSHDERDRVPQIGLGIYQVPPTLAHLPQHDQLAVPVVNLLRSGGGCVREVRFDFPENE